MWEEDALHLLTTVSDYEQEIAAQVHTVGIYDDIGIRPETTH